MNQTVSHYTTLPGVVHIGHERIYRPSGVVVYKKDSLDLRNDLLQSNFLHVSDVIGNSVTNVSIIELLMKVRGIFDDTHFAVVASREGDILFAHKDVCAYMLHELYGEYTIAPWEQFCFMPEKLGEQIAACKKKSDDVLRFSQEMNSVGDEEPGTDQNTQVSMQSAERTSGQMEEYPVPEVNVSHGVQVGLQQNMEDTALAGEENANEGNRTGEPSGKETVPLLPSSVEEGMTPIAVQQAGPYTKEKSLKQSVHTFHEVMYDLSVSYAHEDIYRLLSLMPDGWVSAKDGSTVMRTHSYKQALQQLQCAMYNPICIVDRMWTNRVWIEKKPTGVEGEYLYLLVGKTADGVRVMLRKSLTPLYLPDVLPEDIRQSLTMSLKEHAHRAEVSPSLSVFLTLLYSTRRAETLSDILRFPPCEISRWVKSGGRGDMLAEFSQYVRDMGLDHYFPARGDLDDR